MNKKTKRIRQKGFAVIGVVIALVMLGSMAVGLSALVAANQRTKFAQTYMNQAFYVSHASLEYSLRNVVALNSSTIPNRQLLRTNFNITSSKKLSAVTNYGQTSHIAANSVSIANPAYAPSCAYVLASTGSNALALNGTGDIAATTCGINVNSTSASAVQMVGNSTLSAYFLKIVGGYSKGSNNTITTHNGSIGTGVNAVSDPLSYLNMPTYSSCTYNNISISGSGNTTLNPGVYCNGITITGSGTTTLNPGNYIIDGGEFSAAGTAQVVGSGVTIFLNSQLVSGYPNLKLTGSGLRTISAPTNGTYAGIAVFQSRNAPGGNNTLTGSGSLNVTGAIYLPNQALSYGGSSSSSPCTLLVVNTLSIFGTANIGCASGDLSGLIP